MFLNNMIKISGNSNYKVSVVKTDKLYIIKEGFTKEDTLRLQKQIEKQERFSESNKYTIKTAKIINKDNTTQDNFLDKYTLYGNDIYTKKIENITNLPVHYYSMNIKKLSFYSKGSKNQMIIEMEQDKIINLYFTSKDKKLSENNYFFNKDISLYLKSLNI